MIRITAETAAITIGEIRTHILSKGVAAYLEYKTAVAMLAELKSRPDSELADDVTLSALLIIKPFKKPLHRPA
jgi:hypothetical protein